MSTLEKNIKTIEEKLAALKKGSRAYIKYTDRLSKKIDQYKRYTAIRTREESLLVKEALNNGIEIDITTLKFKSAFK